jgi:hypothetical protein
MHFRVKRNVATVSAALLALAVALSGCATVGSVAKDAACSVAHALAGLCEQED